MANQGNRDYFGELLEAAELDDLLTAAEGNICLEALKALNEDESDIPEFSLRTDEAPIPHFLPWRDNWSITLGVDEADNPHIYPDSVEPY